MQTWVGAMVICLNCLSPLRAFFMYLKEIGACFGKLFWQKKLWRSRGRNTDENYTSVDNEERSVMDDSMLNTPDSTSSQREIFSRDRGTIEAETESQSSLLPGFIKIRFFFHQTQALFKFSVTSESTGVSDLLKEIIIGIFNFKVDGESYRIVWCPFQGLYPVGKSMLKTALAAYVVAIVILFNVFAELIRKLTGIDQCASVSEQGRRFDIRLVNCSVPLILLSYSTL